MSRLHHTARALASGYAAMASNALFALASVPLALHYLSKEEFGLWALASQVATYLLLIDGGITASVSRTLIDHKDHKADGAYGSVFQTGGLVLLVQGICIALGGFLLSFFLPALLGVPDALVGIFRVLVTGQCLLFGAFYVGGILMGVLQAHQRFDILNYSQILQLAMGFATQWVTFHRGWGLYSLLAGGFVMHLGGFANNLTSVVRLQLLPPAHAWGRPGWKIFKEVFAFANDLFLLMLGLQLLNASQVVIISQTQGLAAAAVWSIATRTFQLGFQFVQRIFAFSAVALGEMMVRGEHETLRRRFRDILMLTVSSVVFTSASLAVCNGSFLTLWTKGKVVWPWWNDALLGVLLAFNCVSHCYIGLAGYAKQVTTMRWVYFLEGATFVAAGIVVAPRFGTTGIILMAIVANVAWSGAYGVRWGSRYLGVSVGEVALGWLRPAIRYLLVMAPLTASLWWGTFALPTKARFAVNAGTMLVAGLSLFWFIGLSPELRNELKGAFGRVWPWREKAGAKQPEGA